jgi:hypothetical protein
MELRPSTVTPVEQVADAQRRQHRDRAPAPPAVLGAINVEVDPYVEAADPDIRTSIPVCSSSRAGAARERARGEVARSRRR